MYAENCAGCHGARGEGYVGPPLAPAGFASLVAPMVDAGRHQHAPVRRRAPQPGCERGRGVRRAGAGRPGRPDRAGRPGGGASSPFYCSGCHSATGSGGAMAKGRNAPNIRQYPPAEALAAMILGRGNMPAFAGDAFDVRQQTSVALYVQVLAPQPPSPKGRRARLSRAGHRGRGRRHRTAAAHPRRRLARLALQGSEAVSAAGQGRGPRPHVRTWPVGLGITATIGGAIAFVWSLVAGASNQWLGGSLALALLGLGLALAFWGRDLAGDEVLSGRYPVPPDDTDGQAALATQLDEHASVITRRSFLSKFLILGAVVFALSQVAPARRARALARQQPVHHRLAQGAPARDRGRRAGHQGRARHGRLPRRLPRGRRRQGELPGCAAALRRRRLRTAAGP